LAQRLTLTPAAVRRHLTVLLENGQLASERKRVYGARGRGRPSSVFVLTDAGRAEFYQAYDKLAINALEYLESVGGQDAVTAFAGQVTQNVVERYHALRPEYNSAAAALVAALTAEGFVASLQPAVVGDQLCQYHCPVAHVAAEFPQICEAETKIFAELLGSHVQRIATIAHGDSICNTHVPHPIAKPPTP
jgi:predicted ArsR family transcriptional regulator